MTKMIKLRQIWSKLISPNWPKFNKIDQSILYRESQKLVTKNHWLGARARCALWVDIFMGTEARAAVPDLCSSFTPPLHFSPYTTPPKNNLNQNKTYCFGGTKTEAIKNFLL